MHPQLTVEILLPELGKPNVSSVVGQRAASEIPVKRCERRQKVRKHNSSCSFKCHMKSEVVECSQILTRSFGAEA